MDYTIFRDYLNPFNAKLQGRILEESISIPTNHGKGSKLQYCVYLPPGYDKNKKQFRILYHLHGAGATLFMMRKDVSWMAFELERAGEEMIIAAPYDSTKFSMWADGKKTDIASQIHNHFIPHIEKTYCPGVNEIARSLRFIQGFSMGGFGAAVHGFKYHDKFGKIIIWDGALHDWETLTESKAFIAKDQFGDDETNFQSWSPYQAATKACAKVLDTPVRMYSGKFKMTDVFAKKYKAHLDEKQVDCIHTRTDAPHNLKTFLQAHGQEAIQFLASESE